MLIRLILLFTLAPLLELALLIYAGGHIGVWNTVGLVALTGLAGAVAARSQGFAVLGAIREDLASGRMPGDEILNGIIILCGGILFLAPGFITDAAGFAMLFPKTRRFLKKMISLRIRKFLEGRESE